LQQLRKGFAKSTQDLAIQPCEIKPLISFASLFTKKAKCEEGLDETDDSDVEWLHQVLVGMRLACCNIASDRSPASLDPSSAYQNLLVKTVDALKLLRASNSAQEKLLRDRIGNAIVPE
jgi:hypothetical protein